MTLKELRKSKGLTQKACCEFLGIPQRTYCRYEASANPDDIKYKYIFEKLSSYGVIDEMHGILSVDDIKSATADVFKSYGVKFAYLFGSYAKGVATEVSDVDILVSAFTDGLKFYALIEDLRAALKKNVDLVDAALLSNNPELLTEILTDGIRIYG